MIDPARCVCSNPGQYNGEVLWEGGHFYESKGPTRWSQVGWDIVSTLRQAGDHSMIMVDNVHGIELVNDWERKLPNIEFQPDPCFVLREGDMAGRTFEVLADLKKISPRRKRARYAMRPRRWTCSGLALTNGSNLPTCLGYDLGLTRLKYDLGFRRIVNVLPAFYRSEQWALMRIVRKVMPDLEVRAVLYDLSGNWRWLRPGDPCQPG